MKTNEIRYWLHNFEGLKDEIIEIEECLRQYRVMEIETFIVPVLDDMPKGKGKTSSPVENAAISRLTQIERMENRLFYLRTILAAINLVIKAYTDDSNEWRILKMRYFDSKKMQWMEIADELGYSEQNVKKIDGILTNKIMSLFFRKIKVDE